MMDPALLREWQYGQSNQALSMPFGTRGGLLMRDPKKDAEDRETRERIRNRLRDLVKEWVPAR